MLFAQTTFNYKKGLHETGLVDRDLEQSLNDVLGILSVSKRVICESPDVIVPSVLLLLRTVLIGLESVSGHILVLISVPWNMMFLYAIEHFLFLPSDSFSSGPDFLSHFQFFHIRFMLATQQNCKCWLVVFNSSESILNALPPASARFLPFYYYHHYVIIYIQPSIYDIDVAANR